MKSLNKYATRNAIRTLPSNTKNNIISQVIDGIFSTGRNAVRNITGFRRRPPRRVNRRIPRPIRFESLAAPSTNSNRPLKFFNVPTITKYLEFIDTIQLQVDSSLKFVGTNSSIYTLFSGINSSDQFKAYTNNIVAWRPLAAKITMTSAIEAPTIVDNNDNIQHKMILPNVYFQIYTGMTDETTNYLLYNKPTYLWNPSKRTASFVINYNNPIAIEPQYIRKWLETSNTTSNKPQTISMIIQSDMVQQGTLTSAINLGIITIQYKILCMVHDIKVSATHNHYLNGHEMEQHDDIPSMDDNNLKPSMDDNEPKPSMDNGSEFESINEL